MKLGDEAHNELIARGKQIADSGKYLRPRGELLGHIEAWGLDVYEGSPKPWIDALFAEQDWDLGSHGISARICAAMSNHRNQAWASTAVIVSSSSTLAWSTRS